MAEIISRELTQCAPERKNKKKTQISNKKKET